MEKEKRGILCSFKGLARAREGGGGGVAETTRFDSRFGKRQASSSSSTSSPSRPYRGRREAAAADEVVSKIPDQVKIRWIPPNLTRLRVKKHTVSGPTESPVRSSLKPKHTSSKNSAPAMRKKRGTMIYAMFPHGFLMGRGGTLSAEKW